MVEQFDPATDKQPESLRQRLYSVAEVWMAFAVLGLTSFGGPVAHVGYFRTEFVHKRAWLSDGQFAQLLALCQFLPGPASSQLGFAIGLQRAGWLGALTAFVAFTLPSVVILLAFAYGLQWQASSLAQAALSGLKLVAVVVVAHGVYGMWCSLCTGVLRKVLALAAAVVIVVVGHGQGQLWMIAAGAVLGAILLRDTTPVSSAHAGQTPLCRYSFTTGMVWLMAFIGLLVLLPVLAQGSVWWDVLSRFYHTGALVFGGGHVVLPLLQESVVAAYDVSSQDFLAGYGVAQALPGPLFSIAAYVGALLPAPFGGVTGALLCVLAIFLPGFLLLLAVLPAWQKVSQWRSVLSMVAGVNAVVVGILAAALYDPIIRSSLLHFTDVLVVAIGLAMLWLTRLSVLWVVLWCVAAKLALALLSGM